MRAQSQQQMGIGFPNSPKTERNATCQHCQYHTTTICSGSTRTTIHCNQTHAQPSTRFCGRETSRGPRAALAAIKLSRCDSLRLVLMLCLPKPSASRGQRSTQNTKTSHAENHENNSVQCAHDKWLTNENWLNNRCVLCEEKIALVYATFAVHLAAVGSVKVTSSPNVSTRIWQI